ncbi:MAG TPA: hypothetical protein PLQ76_07185 [bacterium]|nr:hypothetical protein [bacterium]
MFRRIYNCFKYPALGIVAVFSLILIWELFFVKDIPRIDDSIMLKKPAAVDARLNAWPLAAEACVDYRYAKKVKWDTLSMAMYRYPERVALLKKAVLLPKSQGKPLKGPGDRIPIIMSLRWLTEALLKNAESESAANPAAAQEKIRLVFKTGGIIEAPDGYGIIIGNAIGCMLKYSAAEELNRLMQKGLLSRNDLAGWADFLKTQKTSDIGYRYAMRNEYYSMTRVLEDIKKSDARQFEYITPYELSLTAYIALDNHVRRFVFKPERIRKEYYRRCLRDFNNAALPASKMVTENTVYDVKPFSVRTFSRLLSGDFGTDVFMQHVYFDMHKLLIRRRYVDFVVEGLRVKAAALAYMADNGSSPKSLNDLVPEYLNSVPRDPFDGAALRYDSRKGIVYSVGTNLRDDGGVSESRIFEGYAKDIEGKTSWQYKYYSAMKDLVISIK